MDGMLVSVIHGTTDQRSYLTAETWVVSVVVLSVSDLSSLNDRTSTETTTVPSMAYHVMIIPWTIPRKLPIYQALDSFIVKFYSHCNTGRTTFTDGFFG